MDNPRQYDFIIAGGGCAGLSLAMHLINSGRFTDHRVLVIDRAEKNTNDRTWCFWERTPGLFQPVVFREWEKLSFFSRRFQKTFDTLPYKYKMIRGIDFYRHCREVIKRQKNFEIVIGEVTGFSPENTRVTLETGEVFQGKKIFSSILPEVPDVKDKTWLLQHFKGWVIETDIDAFDPASATIMDFRIGQEHGASFCYVLPYSERQALVEFTVFSADILDKHQYDEKLKQYIEQVLGINKYTIQEEEFGVIPMTDFLFPGRQDNIIYIGTAGGQTKGSTGYTFNFIQKHSRQLVKELSEGITVPHVKKRHRFYDSVMLGVLESGTMPGEEIFERMFSRNKLASIFRFLDNESSLPEEIGIIRTLPTMPFLRSAIRKINK